MQQRVLQQANSTCSVCYSQQSWNKSRLSVHKRVAGGWLAAGAGIGACLLCICRLCLDSSAQQSYLFCLTEFCLLHLFRDVMDYTGGPVSAFQQAMRGRAQQLRDHICKDMNPLNLERCR